MESIIQDYLSTTSNVAEKMESINRAQIEFMVSQLRLLNARLEYLRLSKQTRQIKTTQDMDDFFFTYKCRILFDTMKMFSKVGNRGVSRARIFMSSETISNPIKSEVVRTAQTSFDKFQLIVLSNEIMREYTANIFTHARAYLSRLSDERTGRLFKSFSAIDSMSTSMETPHAYQITEEDYTAKSAMLNSFVSDLHLASVKFVCDIAALNPIRLGNLEIRKQILGEPKIQKAMHLT